MRIAKLYSDVVAFMAATMLVLSGCQGIAPTASSNAPLPQKFTLDKASLIQHLADKQGVNWEDSLMNFPALKARQRSGRHLLATGCTSACNTWNYSIPSGVSSSLAFLKARPDVAVAPGTLPGDYVYALSDNGTVYKIDPSTNPSVTPPTSQVAGSAALPSSSYAKSAIMISADNRRLYAIDSAGDFTILDAQTLQRRWSAKISSSGFANTAPFLDYGSNTSGGTTVFGSIEDVFCVSADGSTYRVIIDDSTSPMNVRVYAGTSSSGTDKNSILPSWTQNTSNGVSLASGTTVKTFPIAWKAQVYFGAGGKYYGVNMFNLPAVSTFGTWNLAPNTTATGTGATIGGTAAIDYDDNDDVNAIFVGCGDRLNWINPQTNKVTVSPSLTLDRSAGVANPGTLGSYTPTTSVTKYYNPTDWVSIKSSTIPPPSRWSGPLSSVSNGSATSVRMAPNGDIWVTEFSANQILIYHTNGSITTISTTTAAPGGPGSGGAQPDKLEFDPAGNCWVSCNGIFGGGGMVVKYSPAGAYLGSCTISGAVYIAPDNLGECWVTSYNAKRLYKLKSNCTLYNTTLIPSGGITVNNAGTVFVDPATNYVWAMPYMGNTIQRYKQDGTALGTITTGGTAPINIVFKAGQAWVTLNQSQKIQVFNASTGASVSTINTPLANPWTLRFDNNGNLWVTYCVFLNTSTGSWDEINSTTGAEIAGTRVATTSSQGNPMELIFDSTNTGYVACSNNSFSSGALLIFGNDIGNTLDLFGSAYRAIVSGTPDSDKSYAFMKFKVAANAFGNQPVTKATLTVTADANVSGDNLDMYNAANTRPSDGALWTGYTTGGATPNVDAGNSPAVGDSPFTSLINQSPLGNTSITFEMPHLADQLNSTDSTADYTYAMQTNNKMLSASGHFYSFNSAGIAASTYNTNVATTRWPLLTVTLDSFAKTSTSTPGISCQPIVESDMKKIFVNSCNALFELDYSSTGKFQSPSATHYEFTQGGLSTGPVNSAKNYLFPTGNMVLAFDAAGDERIITTDLAPTAGSTLELNNFNINNADTTVRLKKYFNMTPGTGAVVTQMLNDYDNGSIYLVTSNNYVIRTPIVP